MCYNGDVYGAEDVTELKRGTKDALKSIMIGRGMLRDPSLIRTLSGGSPYSRGELKEFLSRLCSDYSELFSGEKPVLQKMKELWGYMKQDFPKKERQVNALLKCRSLSEYRVLEMSVL